MTINKMILKVCLLVLVGLMFSGSAIAFINKQIDQAGIVVQCPPKVKCDGDRNSLTCIGQGDNAKYWTLDNKAKDLVKGSYVFSSAIVLEHIDKLDYEHPASSMLFCSYEYEDFYPFPVDTLVLKPKSGGHFFPVMNSKQSPTGWNEDKWRVAPGYNRAQICDSSDATSCPFREAPVIAIGSYVANKDYSLGDDLRLEMYVNQKPISPDFLSGEEFNVCGYNVQEKFSYLGYDKLLAACGSIKQCVIYIRKLNGDTDNYASLTIDFTNGMKIIDVKSPKGGMRTCGYHYATATVIKHPLYETVMIMGNN